MADGYNPKTRLTNSRAAYARGEEPTSTQLYFGRALGAMMEFLNLNQSELVPDILAKQPDVSEIISGTHILSPDAMALVPPRIVKAYETQNPDTPFPKEAKWFSMKQTVPGDSPLPRATPLSVQEFTQQGMKLAALDKDYLRIAIAHLLDKRHKPRHFMEDKGGPSRLAVSQFVNNSGKCKNLSTYHIAHMGRELGVKDIFRLEELGVALSMQGKGHAEAETHRRSNRRPDHPSKGEGRE
jgi:hypothetical protein